LIKASASKSDKNYLPPTSLEGICLVGSLKSAYEALVTRGYQLSPEAFSLLEVSDSPEVTAERLLASLETLGDRPLIIEGSHIENLLKREPPRAASPTPPKEQAVVNVISGSYGLQIAGTVEDFRGYFVQRFRGLERILKARADLKDATTVSYIPEGDKWRKTKVIGMVMSKRESKSGVTVVLLEDTMGSAEAVFKSHLKEKASRILMDEVVCVSGSTKNGRTIMADDVVWPDISPRIRSSSARQDSYVVMTSDLHIGSKLFMKDNFESFLDWIGGENGDGATRDIAQNTKYLIIAGDVVDGVGVYPNQEDELSIKDLNRQYEKAAEYLSLVPPHIKIIIIPGNHDACRPTLPTPPIYKEYADSIYSMKNVVMLGDPAVVNLDGATFLLTHGRSLDDIIPALPNCSFKEPQKAMVELLKSRHISPIYGERTPIAPEALDTLIIDPVPDIFLAGHVHVWGVSDYRGVVVANAGTWQGQTNYQLSMGIEPKPGVVPVVNLRNFKATTMKFI
jgi:DNA polymerase II small subunit